MSFLTNYEMYVLIFFGRFMKRMFQSEMLKG